MLWAEVDCGTLAVAFHMLVMQYIQFSYDIKTDKQKLGTLNGGAAVYINHANNIEIINSTK